METLRHIVFVTITCALGSCATSSIDHPPAPPINWQSLQQATTSAASSPTAKTSAKDRQLAQLYVKALASPDFVDLGPLLNEDAHFTFAGVHDVHGRGLTVKMLQALLGDFNSRTFAATRILLTQNSQIIEWTMSAVHAATAKPIVLRGVSMLWTSGGSISDLHMYYDQAVLKDQFGTENQSIAIQSVGEMEAQPLQPAEIFEASAPESAQSASVAVVGAALDAMQNRRPAAYAAIMAEDVVLHTLQDSAPLAGRNFEREYARAMSASIAGLDITIDNSWAFDAIAVVEYHVVGELRGVTPAKKGSLIKLFFVDIVEVRDGHISRIWRYDDPSQLASSSDDGP